MHMPPPVHGAAMMGQYIHDSLMINQMFDCRYVNIATANNINDIGQGGLKKIITFINKLKTIQKASAAFHPDLVYITPAAAGIALYKDYIMVQFLKRRCQNVVLHYHNKGVAQNSKKWYNRLLYKRLFCDVRVILLSELLYPDISSYVSQERVMICPNGIPDSNCSLQKTKRGHKLQILFLSNLISSKGILTLLDALVLMKNENIHCSIAGAPGDISVSRLQTEIERRGIQDMVTYHGATDADQKLALFGQTDIFAFPTENDCFPLVLLEAMRSGVPCVTTDEGAIVDLVKDGQNGYIVEKQNAEKLAKKLQWLEVHKQERLQMGMAGRKMYERNYTVADFEKRICDILTMCAC